MKMWGLLTTPYSMSPLGTPVMKSATRKEKGKRLGGAISKQDNMITRNWNARYCLWPINKNTVYTFMRFIYPFSFILWVSQCFCFLEDSIIPFHHNTIMCGHWAVKYLTELGGHQTLYSAMHFGSLYCKYGPHLLHHPRWTHHQPQSNLQEKWRVEVESR